MEGQGRGLAGQKFKDTLRGDKNIKELQPIKTGRETLDGGSGGLQVKPCQVGLANKRAAFRFRIRSMENCCIVTLF